MNDHEIRNAFGKLTETADPARVEERVRGRTTAKTERKRLRFPRAVLAAACILAVTAVSAGAYAVYRNIRIQVHPDGNFAYTAMFRDAGTETVVLSEDVMAELAERGVRNDGESGESFYERRVKFDTWEDAAEWLDCGVLTSDLLGGTLQNTVWGADILLSPYYVEGELYSVGVYGTNDLPYDDPLSFCRTEVLIPVSEELHRYIAEGRFGTSAALTGNTAGDTEVISYTSESGLSAEIAVTYMDRPDKRFAYEAHAFLLHGGIVYEFVLANEEKNTALTWMKELIDSLH